MVTFVEHIMPPHYFNGDLASARDDQHVLRKIVQIEHPEIHEMLQRYDFDLSIVTFGWFMTLFADDMSHDVTLQVSRMRAFPS